MENLEIKVIPQVGVVRCDFETAKQYLAEKLEEYKGIVFTEETKQSAKSTVAELRKEKKAFSDRIKEVRTEYMKPFNDFAEQANALVDMFDEPINEISSQVAEFERKRVDEKRLLIKSMYDECISDMTDFLPLAKLYNPKWENATTSNTAIRKELMTRKEEAKKAIAAIKEMHSDVEGYALEMYKQTFNLTDAILYINKHEEQKREILAREQERVRQEEEERIRREEREKIEAAYRAEKEKEQLLRQAEEEKLAAVETAREEAAQEVIDSLIASGDGEAELYEYRISLTAEQKEKLEMYLTSVGIEWEMM